MKLSDLLLDKLNSDEILSKRVQLAKNVFISADLRVAYKEEHILMWFLQAIQGTDDEETRKQLINGFCFCVETEIMTLLPASGIRVSAKSNISKLIRRILKGIDQENNNFADSVFVILKKFSLHYKSHPKQFVKVMYALLNLTLNNSQVSQVFQLSSDIFRSGILHEKFVMHLLQKDFELLFRHLDGINSKNDAVIQFIQKMFFRKEVLTQFEMVLHSICSGNEITGINQIIPALLKSLHEIYASDLDVKIKVQAYSVVFKALARSVDSDESVGTLQFFIVLCHLIGLEQAVLLQPTPDEPAKPVINKNHFQGFTDISSIKANETSYIIVKHLIEILSSCSPNLNGNLCDSTYLQWFLSFISGAITHEQLSHVHLDFFCACSDLDTSIIERNFIKIFSHLLKQSQSTIKADDFQDSFQNFMEYMLKMYSKLQRIQKFILKLLQSMRSAKSDLVMKDIFSNDFIREFSNLITLMPSTQSLSFMDDMLKSLNEDCVQVLEENNDYVNVLFIQSSCALLAAFLCGVRVLSHTTPPGIVTSFIEKNRQIKEILGRFGKALLVRIHDRDIVQPFLNLSFYWGEFELLVLCYLEEQGANLINKDISPADLSTLHSYLCGEEWNVLAERVSNFGAEQCYQLFLKLILQKLRTLELKNCSSLISGEATSKHILTQLTSELYRHDIVEELTPEDVASLLNYLPQRQSFLLLDKLYLQVIEAEDCRKALEWMSGSVLLERHNFILLSLVIILQKISSKLSSMNKKNGASGIPFKALALDFVSEEYKVNNDEYAKLVGHVNELLNGGIVFPLDSNVKLAHIKIFIDILKCLPLVYMPHEVSSLALSGLIFLAIVFSRTEELLKPLLLVIYSLVQKTSRSTTFSSFNCGLCIRWLLYIDSKCGTIRQTRNNLVKLLLKTRANNENGLRELKELIEFMQKKKLKEDPKSLENQILLYQNLGKRGYSFMRAGQSITTDFYCQQLQEMMRHLQIKQPRLVYRGRPILLEGNARPHVIGSMLLQLQRPLDLENLCHPVYSPDFAPTDYDSLRAFGQFLTWVKSKKRNMANEEISRFRQKLSKRIRKELEKQNEKENPTVDCEVLVMAYTIELTRAVKLKQKENIVSLINLNFDKFFDIAVAKVENGSRDESYVNFLTNVLVHMPDLKDHLNKSTLKTAWNALKWKTKVDWKLFHGIANDQEFEFFLMDLLKVWGLFAKGKLNKKLDLGNYFDIWKEFYNVDKPAKKKLHEKYLKNLFVLFCAGVPAMNDFTPEQIVQLYNFIRFCISTSNIVMTSTMLDCSIDIMYNYNYKETLSIRDFQMVFESCINAVSWSLTTRAVRIRDKIHNLFQLFVKLLDALGKRSNAAANITEGDLLSLSSCAHNMEKWTSKMVQNSKDFSRMAVYFIAALVSSFVRINIYPAVKAPLTNCIHNFLSISDSHNISHLARVFNPGSQQVFNGIYENYKKYYKYKGKV